MKKFQVHSKFYLNKYKSKGDRFQIYLRLTYHQKKAEIATNHFLETKEWLPEKERAKKNLTVNKDLSDIENKVHEITTQLEKSNKPIEVSEIKKYLTKKEKFDKCIVEFYESFLERLKKAGEVENVTIEMYGNIR